MGARRVHRGTDPLSDATLSLGELAVSIPAGTAFDNIRLKARVLKVMGPGGEALPGAIGELRALMGGDGSVLDTDLSALSGLGGVVGRIFADSDPDAVAALIRDVVQDAKRDSGGVMVPLNMNADLAPEHIYPLFWACLKVRLGPFFKGFGTTPRQGKAD